VPTELGKRRTRNAIAASVAAREVRLTQRLAAGLKHCPRCDTWLPLDEFTTARASVDGKVGYCRPCQNRRIAEWKRARAVKIRQAEAERLAAEAEAERLAHLRHQDGVRRRVEAARAESELLLRQRMARVLAAARQPVPPIPVVADVPEPQDVLHGWVCWRCAGPITWNASRQWWRIDHASNCRDTRQPIAPDAAAKQLAV
jgi:hypothetical protein